MVLTRSSKRSERPRRNVVNARVENEMVIYRFPPESNEESGSKKESKSGKLPDFIYVDDRSSQEESWGSSSKEPPFLGSTAGQVHYPFFLRFLTLLIACMLTMWVGVLIVLFLVFTVITIILFFKSPSTIQAMGKLWKSIGNCSAYALALFVATLNPAFGFGIFALYALQSGESPEKMPFNKMFQGRF